MLTRNGVPEHRAFSMDRDERLAWVIVLGMLDGGQWDWDEMSWKRQ